jgi:prepilin-type N-terminal cleavage/methylation domain-containing protein
MKKGFTLIELMIVVAIIAILVGTAIPNLLRSRMAANEAAAIAACKAFATAEDIYRRTDWNEDGILEYSTTITGDYSLFETQKGSGDIQLLDAAFARAATGSILATDCTAPKAGYSFWVLTGQGPLAPGGSKSYVVKEHMTIGYGLSAVPFVWDASGRNTYQISNAGTIFQQDRLSVETDHLTVYEPGQGWVATE